jgi:hypothetical protein
MDFEQAIEQHKRYWPDSSFGEDVTNVVKATMKSAAIDVDAMIEEYRQQPGHGSTVQLLRSLRKAMANTYYNASVLESLLKGGDFSHQSIPEEEWVTT